MSYFASCTFNLDDLEMAMQLTSISSFSYLEYTYQSSSCRLYKICIFKYLLLPYTYIIRETFACKMRFVQGPNIICYNQNLLHILCTNYGTLCDNAWELIVYLGAGALVIILVLPPLK